MGLIRTNAGRWALNIGATGKFTRTSPYRYTAAQRTRIFRDAFGEEGLLKMRGRALPYAAQTKRSPWSTTHAALDLFRKNHNAVERMIIEFQNTTREFDQFTEVWITNSRKITVTTMQRSSLLPRFSKIHSCKKERFDNWMKEAAANPNWGVKQTYRASATSRR